MEYDLEMFFRLQTSTDGENGIKISKYFGNLMNFSMKSD